MKVWTDKQGEKLTAKEFFVRWGEGIQKITPMQLSLFSVMGILMMLIGVCIGLYFTWSSNKWLFTILLGSLFLVVVNLIGTLQRVYTLYKVELDKQAFLELELKGGMNNDVSE